MGFKEQLEQVTQKQTKIINDLTNDINSILSETWFTKYIVKQVEYRNLNSQSDTFKVYFTIDRENINKPIIYRLSLHADNELASANKTGEVIWSTLQEINKIAMTQILEKIIYNKINSFKDVENVYIVEFKLESPYYKPIFMIEFKNPLK